MAEPFLVLRGCKNHLWLHIIEFPLAGDKLYGTPEVRRQTPDQPRHDFC